MAVDVTPYLVDPNDPRAPSQSVWDRMSDAERARVVESLPSEFPVRESAPPEGDPHREEQRQALEEAERRRDQAERAREEERRAREEAEHKLAQALAEIERLRRER